MEYRYEDTPCGYHSGDESSRTRCMLSYYRVILAGIKCILTQLTVSSSRRDSDSNIKKENKYCTKYSSSSTGLPGYCHPRCPTPTPPISNRDLAHADADNEQQRNARSRFSRYQLSWVKRGCSATPHCQIARARGRVWRRHGTNGRLIQNCTDTSSGCYCKYGSLYVARGDVM